MKLTELIRNLEIMLKVYGDLDCYYAEDDEGNSYEEITNIPTVLYKNEDEELLSMEDIEYLDLDEDDVEAVCIVN